LPLYEELAVEGGCALIPRAMGNSWYPLSFLAPIDSNQPYLDSALRVVENLVTGLIARSVLSNQIIFLGFSQGACLTLEFIARNPRRYGGVIGLAEGLIGPPGTSREYSGFLEGTPVFLGASDPDPHVPFERVRESEEVLSRMGARIELRRYPGMEHTIISDEIAASRTLIRNAVAERRK